MNGDGWVRVFPVVCGCCCFHSFTGECFFFPVERAVGSGVGDMGCGLRHAGCVAQNYGMALVWMSAGGALCGRLGWLAHPDSRIGGSKKYSAKGCGLVCGGCGNSGLTGVVHGGVCGSCASFPVPKGSGPGAPSSRFGKVIEIRAARPWPGYPVSCGSMRREMQVLRLTTPELKCARGPVRSG